MRVLFAGQFKVWSIEHHYAKYLKSYAEVFTYPAEDVFDDYYWPSPLNKAIFKLGVSRIYNRIAIELVAKAQEVNPDIVWVFKGMRILPKALKDLREMGIKVVNYNPDHPFFFSSRGSGNSNVTASIGLYDMHLCYDKRVAQRIEKEFGIQTAMLPFGYELSEADFNEIKNAEEVNEACFIGTCDKIRVDHVMHVASHGIPVNVFGNSWAKMLPGSAKNVIVHDPVYGKDFWLNMRKYRLQLNIFRPHNIGSHNMRTFETPAVGGIQLAPDSPDHREYFEPEKEIFLYRSKGEMVSRAKEILALSKAEADIIRQRARNRSVSCNYSYERRAKQALDAFNELMETVPVAT